MWGKMKGALGSKNPNPSLNLSLSLSLYLFRLGPRLGLRKRLGLRLG